MKKMLSALIFAVLLAVLIAPVPAGAASDYDNALKAAKGGNKPVLLYFYSKTCYYCTVMDKKTLAESDVSSILKRDFVYLRVDADKASDLTRLYRITGTPSSWFLEPSGKRIFEAPGYIDKPTYKKLLEYVKGKHYNDTDIQTFMKKASNQ